MKKLIIVLLCLTVMLLPMLASCVDNGPTVSQDDTSSSSESSKPDESKEEDEIPGYNSETGLYEPDLPEYKWEEGKIFKVLVYSNVKQDTYFSEDIEAGLYSTTDEALSSAVAERNNRLYERYNNVTIKAYCVDDVVEELRKEISGANVGYDAAMPFLGNATALAQENYFYDLASADFKDYINLSMPWWDSNFTDTMSIGDSVYFAVGDISIMQKIVSSSVLFNKPLLEEVSKTVGEELDLFQEVRDGTWTFDRMYQLAKAYTQESDGSQGMTYKDKWGLVASYGLPVSYYLASGESFVKKNASGTPYIYIGSTERSLTVAQKVLSRFAEKDTWRLYCNEISVSGTTIWQAGLDVFGENRALFYNSAFSAIKKLRSYKDLNEWGFLPLPKIDETQDTYYTPCTATWAYGITIPVTAPDPEFSAFMIEAMAAEAKNTITPAYYETVLKGRDTKDPESEEMLDEYIFANIKYDLGALHDFGGISSVFSTLAQSYSSDITSKLDSIKGEMQSDIDKLLAAYDQ